MMVVFILLLVGSRVDASLKEQVSVAHLQNGMKVLLVENHKAPAVSFQVWYRVGSRDEPWGKSGLSHLLEHMMFKGTETVSGSAFTQALQENGAKYNAFTTKDFTTYFEDVSADRVGVVMGLEADRMQHLTFREEDFRTERMVVMEERRMRTDNNPHAYLLEQMDAAAFQNEPYHWPTIGWMSDLSRITLEDLKSYYATYYNPANAFLVVVGDFKKSTLLPEIERLFGSIPKGAEPARYRYSDPPQTGERRIVVNKEAQLPFLIMGHHVPNINDSDSYVLDVIAAVLSGGKSSRLYENLVLKKRLALSVDAENSLLSVDPGLFYITAEPLPGKDATALERAIELEIAQLQKTPLKDEELRTAKNQIEAAFTFSQDSLFQQGILLGRHEMALDWKTIDDYIPSIRKVTPDDIMRVANQYLYPESRTVAVLTPTASKTPPKVQPGAAESPIKNRAIR